MKLLKFYILLLFCIVLSLSEFGSLGFKFNYYANKYFASFMDYKDKTPNSFEISITYKSLQNKGYYENLFQTDFFNNGIRAEIDPQYDLRLIFPKNIKGKEVIIDNIYLGRVKQNQKYTLNLKYFDKKFIINIAGKNYIINKSELPLPIKFNNIVIGEGYNGVKFLGKIYKYSYDAFYLPNYDFGFYVTMILLFLIFVLIKKIVSNPNLQKLNLSTNLIQNKNRYNGILVLRIMFCLYVLIEHSIIFFIPEGAPVEKLMIFNFDFTFLKYPPLFIGAYMFFVISGFLMSKNFLNQNYKMDKENILKFYTRRANAIIPNYILCMMIMILFKKWYFLIGWDNIRLVIRNITFTAQHYENLVNGATWALSCVMWFYVLAPYLTCFIDYLVKKINLFTTTLLFIILSCLSRFIFMDISKGENFGMQPGLHNDYVGFFSIEDVYMPLIFNIFLFIFGILANYYIDYFAKKKVNFNRAKIYVVFLLVFMYLFKVIADFKSANNGYVYVFCFAFFPTILGLIISACIIMIESYDIQFNKINKKGILFWFAMGAFYVYVWAEIVNFKIFDIVNRNGLASGFFGFIFYYFCMLVFGIFLYIILEKPYKKSK